MRSTWLHFGGRIRRNWGRRGSILIFVIAILLLLALMGLAYLVSGRADRFAAQRNSYYAQVNQLLGGISRQVTGMIVGDVFNDLGNYRPAGSTYYNHYDTISYSNNPVLLGGDGWLAERAPIPNDVVMPVTAASVWPWTSTTPKWGAVSMSLVNSATPRFTSPDGTGSYDRTNLVPAVRLVNNQYYPAFTVGTGTTKYLAADADGDGIADAGLWPLAMPASNGVTWYAGYRVIDNAGAINASIAWSNASNFDTGTNVPYNCGFFPSDIDLAGVLKGGDTITNLNTWRFGGQWHHYGRCVPFQHGCFLSEEHQCGRCGGPGHTLRHRRRYPAGWNVGVKYQHVRQIAFMNATMQIRQRSSSSAAPPHLCRPSSMPGTSLMR